MPRKWTQFQGGTWYEVDIVADSLALAANTAADAVQDTELDLKAKALSGDMVFKCTPAEVASSAAAVMAAVGGEAAKFVRNVVVTLETAAGEVHTWYSGTRETTVVPTTAGNGTAALEDAEATITFAAGTATAVIEYIGSWAAEDECSFTVDAETLLGYTLTDKTSVDTLVA